MVKHILKADFSSYGVPPMIHVVQGDTGREFVFGLGEVADAEAVALMCKRPDGSVYSYAGVIDSWTNTVSFELSAPGGAFTQVGTVEAQLVATVDGVARSFKFNIIVEENISGEPTPEDVAFLDGLQDQLDAWIAGAQDELDALDDKIDQEISDRQAAIAAITVPNNVERVCVPSGLACKANGVTLTFDTLPAGAVIDRIDLYLMVSSGTVPQIRTLYRDTRVLGSFVSTDMGGGNGYVVWNNMPSSSGGSTIFNLTISSGTLWTTPITASDSARAQDSRIYYHIE